MSVHVPPYRHHVIDGASRRAFLTGAAAPAGLNAEYINQVMDGFELEAVCKARRTGDYNIQTGPTSKPQAKLATALMMYRAVVRPWSRKLLALLLASLSAVIVWSEATIGSGRHPDLSPFSLVRALSD